MKKIKEKLENKKLLFLLSIVVIAIIIIIGIIFVTNSKNDGMENTKQISIYYKTYTDEDGWSKWSKNGLTSGNKKYAIKNIKIKVRTKDNGFVSYGVYSNKKWKDDLEEDSSLKNNYIRGLYFYNVNTLSSKYNICYRTYNKKDKWFAWACDEEISGNINENITAVEIKIIPKNVIMYEWLKDYNKTLKDINVGF